MHSTFVFVVIWFIALNSTYFLGRRHGRQTWQRKWHQDAGNLSKEIAVLEGERDQLRSELDAAYAGWGQEGRVHEQTLKELAKLRATAKAEE